MLLDLVIQFWVYLLGLHILKCYFMGINSLLNGEECLLLFQQV